MRIPTALRDAAALAVRELGIAPSATVLTTAALRATLEAVVMQAALDDHYVQYPQARVAAGIRDETGVSVADSHIGAVIQSAHDDQITVVTSDPGDMRLAAGDKDITVAAI